MRILLQHAETKLYFNLLGLWTANPNLAYDFRHTNHALDFARRNELGDVQLVIKFNDLPDAEVVPVGRFRA